MRSRELILASLLVGLCPVQEPWAGAPTRTAVQIGAFESRNNALARAGYDTVVLHPSLVGDDLFRVVVLHGNPAAGFHQPTPPFAGSALDAAEKYHLAMNCDWWPRGERVVPLLLSERKAQLWRKGHQLETMHVATLEASSNGAMVITPEGPCEGRGCEAWRVPEGRVSSSDLVCGPHAWVSIDPEPMEYTDPYVSWLSMVRSTSPSDDPWRHARSFSVEHGGYEMTAFPAEQRPTWTRLDLGSVDPSWSIPLPPRGLWSVTDEVQEAWAIQVLSLSNPEREAAWKAVERMEDTLYRQLGLRTLSFGEEDSGPEVEGYRLANQKILVLPPDLVSLDEASIRALLPKVRAVYPDAFPVRLESAQIKGLRLSCNLERYVRQHHDYQNDREIIARDRQRWIHASVSHVPGEPTSLSGIIVMSASLGPYEGRWSYDFQHDGHSSWIAAVGHRDVYEWWDDLAETETAPSD